MTVAGLVAKFAASLRGHRKHPARAAPTTPTPSSSASRMGVSFTREMLLWRAEVASGITPIWIAMIGLRLRLDPDGPRARRPAGARGAPAVTPSDLLPDCRHDGGVGPYLAPPAEDCEYLLDRLKTLSRDLNALEDMGLITKTNVGFRATSEIILAFCPARHGQARPEVPPTEPSEGPSPQQSLPPSN